MRGVQLLLLFLGVYGVSAHKFRARGLHNQANGKNRLCTVKQTTTHQPPPPASSSSSSQSSSTACANSPTDRQCWGQYNINTDYYATTPNTGKTREYWLTVENVTMAPDGIERPMLVFNNQYPGPTIEADWGDTVIIHVQNKLQNNGTSIHWHGILQEMNNANDGVPGVTQCPIPPGGSFTYTFRATTYGHSWYHSHFSLQYSDGLVGPIVVHGPSSANWDIDLGPMTVTDWFHETAESLYASQLQLGPPGPSDTGLINGMNEFNGSGKYSQITFTPGKKHRIRLINTSTNTHFKFWIDEHIMTVMAADFVPIQPYTTDVLNIAIGQRYDLVFEANQAVGNYWIHALPALFCSANNNLNGILAIVNYEGADTSSLPTSTPFTPPDTNCEDETGLVPVVPRPVGTFSEDSSLDINLIPQDNLVSWTINGSSFFIEYNNPTLLLVEDHDDSFPSSYNVVELNGTDSTWVYFVVQSLGAIIVPHPIHLHGHDFAVLASGSGAYDPSILQNVSLANPTRRDVATLPAPAFGASAGGFLVIAFNLNNPGNWLMHCHIAWHVSEGLAMQFVERIDDIPANVGVTPAWYDLCDSWDAYQNSVNITRDDSGV